MVDGRWGAVSGVWDGGWAHEPYTAMVEGEKTAHPWAAAAARTAAAPSQLTARARAGSASPAADRMAARWMMWVGLDAAVAEGGVERAREREREGCGRRVGRRGERRRPVDGSASAPSPAGKPGGRGERGRAGERVGREKTPRAPSAESAPRTGQVWQSGPRAAAHARNKPTRLSCCVCIHPSHLWDNSPSATARASVTAIVCFF